MKEKNERIDEGKAAVESNENRSLDFIDEPNQLGDEDLEEVSGGDCSRGSGCCDGEAF